MPPPKTTTLVAKEQKGSSSICSPLLIESPSWSIRRLGSSEKMVRKQSLCHHAGRPQAVNTRMLWTQKWLTVSTQTLAVKGADSTLEFVVLRKVKALSFTNLNAWVLSHLVFQILAMHDSIVDSRQTACAAACCCSSKLIHNHESRRRPWWSIEQALPTMDGEERHLEALRILTEWQQECLQWGDDTTLGEKSGNDFESSPQGERSTRWWRCFLPTVGWTLNDSFRKDVEMELALQELPQGTPIPVYEDLQAHFEFRAVVRSRWRRTFGWIVAAFAVIAASLWVVVVIGHGNRLHFDPSLRQGHDALVGFTSSNHPSTSLVLASCSSPQVEGDMTSSHSKKPPVVVKKHSLDWYWDAVNSPRRVWLLLLQEQERTPSIPLVHTGPIEFVTNATSRVLELPSSSATRATAPFVFDLDPRTTDGLVLSPIQESKVVLRSPVAVGWVRQIGFFGTFPSAVAVSSFRSALQASGSEGLTQPTRWIRVISVRRLSTVDVVRFRRPEQPLELSRIKSEGSTLTVAQRPPPKPPPQLLSTLGFDRVQGFSTPGALMTPRRSKGSGLPGIELQGLWGNCGACNCALAHGEWVHCGCAAAQGYRATAQGDKGETTYTMTRIKLQYKRTHGHDSLRGETYAQTLAPATAVSQVLLSGKSKGESSPWRARCGRGIKPN